MDNIASSRDIVDVTLQVWFGYSHAVAGVYFFKVRACRYLTALNYPLIQLGASYIGAAPEIAYMLKEILTKCPTKVASGSSVPKIDGSGSYVVPEDIKFVNCIQSLANMVIQLWSKSQKRYARLRIIFQERN